jgi:HPt (histidine-containing phosphotransfer) domain-containing protein
VTAGNIAHTLKGASGNLGFTALYDAAKELNDMLRQPEFDGQRIQASIAELESAEQALAKALDG